MADVFISYASEDRNRVRPLAEALQARGFDVWWDRALAAGHDYASVIERELRDAKAVIVVWTQSSAASTFVRDEAGRARDEGRLVPVLLDNIQIPLGFGAFQAEDFTRWNGGSNAPQMQILEEAVKAKLEGREVDGGAVARKRRRLMSRIRIVSVLTVIALIVGIAAGGRYLFDPPTPEVQQTDLRAELLRLLEEGRLTPEQAIQLAQILEAGALGETEMADAGATAPAADEEPNASIRSAETMTATTASVSEAEFDEAARETYREALQGLLRHPDAGVRRAAVQLSNPETQDAAMQTMWQWARENPEDPTAAQIYLVCGAVGEANDNPLGQRALEISANLNPRDADVWRMLSRSYRRTNRDREAQGTALASQAAEAEAAGQTEIAEQRLEQAAEDLEAAPEVQASVTSELGAIAESRNDFDTASRRYAEAYQARTAAASRLQYGEEGAREVLQADAQQMVRALDRAGRTEEACRALRQAQQQHDVPAPDQDLLQRCRQLRVQLQPRVQVSPELQRRIDVRRDD